MSMAGFRIQVQERDFSGFVQTVVDETGAMVVDSYMGRSDQTTLVQSENEYLQYFGFPDASKPGGFEAICFARQAPLLAIRALGTGAKFAGIDVLQTSVVGFGTRTGRNIDTFNPASVSTNVAQTVGTGDGIDKTYSGTLTYTPITGGSYQLKVGGLVKASVESGGTITGADATGSLNLSSGVFSIVFTGTSGTPASFTSTIDLSAGVDLSVGGKPKAVNISIDDLATFENVNFGNASGTTRSDIVTAINNALGYTAASNTTDGYSDLIQIVGKKGSSTIGAITISNPTNTGVYDSGVNLIFDATDNPVVQDTAATDPAGACPRANQVISIDYIYTQDITSTLSHSFYTYSQYDDTRSQLAGSVAYVGGTSGQQYTLSLYQVLANNEGLSLIDTYDYSLIREKDNFGRSLYIYDVFKYDPYVRPYVNTAFDSNNPAIPLNPTAQVLFTGGSQGALPSSSNFNTSWAYFRKARTNRAKIFMDVYGGYASTLADLIQNYQDTSFGITMVPAGNNVQGAVQYRQGLGIDFDKLAIYTNWATIADPYNNSFAFTSQIGKIGAKFAQMVDVYDGLSPAGIDENNHGGQLTGFQVIEVEFDYSDEDQRTLDNAQVNPIILDPDFGPMVSGDRTLKVSLSDTSYIHTRRLYNLIIDNVRRQILCKQVFKLNDDIHRFLVKVQTEEILNPILAQNLLEKAPVVCDLTNNTDRVREQRKFILDIYVTATPNSQQVILRLTRLSQTNSNVELLQAPAA